MDEQKQPYRKCAQADCTRPGSIWCVVRVGLRVVRTPYCPSHAINQVKVQEAYEQRSS